MTSRKLQTLWDEEVETELYRRTIKIMEKIQIILFGDKRNRYSI